MSFDVAQILAPATAGLFPGVAASPDGEGANAGDFAAVLESLAGGPEAQVSATAVAPSAGAIPSAFFSQTPAMMTSLPEAGIAVGASAAGDVLIPVATPAGTVGPSDGGLERAAGDVGKDDPDLAPAVDPFIRDALSPIWAPVAPPVPAATPETPVAASGPAGAEAGSRAPQPAAFDLTQALEMVTGQVSPAPVNTPGTSQADLVSTGLADTPPAIPSAQDGDLAPAANLAKRPDAARQDPVALSNESQPAAFALAEGVATVTRQNIPTPVIAPRTPMTEVAPAMPAAQDDDLAPAANLAKGPETARQGPVALSSEPQPAASALPEGVDAVIRQVHPTPVNTARAPQADIPPAMPAAPDSDLAPAVNPVQRPDAARQGPVVASSEPQPGAFAVAEDVAAVTRLVAPTLYTLQTGRTDALPAAPAAIAEDVPPATPAAPDVDLAPAVNLAQRPDAARQGPVAASSEPQPAVAEGVDAVIRPVTPTPVNTLQTTRTNALPAALAAIAEDVPPATPAAPDVDLAPAVNLPQRPDAARQGPVAASSEPQPAAVAVAEGVDGVIRPVTPTPVNTLQTARTDALPATPAAIAEDIPPATTAAPDVDLAPAANPVQRPELASQALLAAGAPAEIRPAEPRRLAASGPTGREPNRAGLEPEGAGILGEEVSAPPVTTASLPATPTAERPGTSPGMPRPVEVIAEEGSETLKAADTQAPLAPAALASASAETMEAPVSPGRATPETIAALSAQMARRLDDGTTRFNLELNPDDLGRVDVRLEIDASGGIRAAFTFERPQSAVELGRRADELQKSLESAGFNLTGGLSFDVAGDRSHGRNPSWADARDDRPHSPVTPEPDLAREGATQIADALSGRRPSSRSGVDIRI
ncbi:flagellar hook-length control protein FliK [Phenylobacterium sp.]|uniref:flagellar hook-length control protein FliK n=1 Tax=Phenylobacterium sp. TaxID=1871053 RepID=UPI0025F69EA4|nr:flagellar hook-length control protein FliK [Phenylobacterium sp.]MCA3742028.1 flagellar hook-length control protein FliK [Phenylobacterium sp.]